MPTSDPEKRGRLFGIDLAAVREALDAMAEAERRLPPGAWILPSALIGGCLIGLLCYRLARGI